MIDNIVFVRELNYRLKYQPNKKDNSFYKTFKMFNGEKNRQIRFSSHGTYLKFWIEKEYDPAFGINISIAFTENGTPTNDCHIDKPTNEPYKDCRPCLSSQEVIGNPCKPRKVPNYNQKKRPFSVTQYVYNCQKFDGSEIETFVNAIKNASINGEYVDPFKGVEGKEAIPVTLEPIEENKKHNKQNINCNKNMNKNRIRLTESQLHRVIRESMKRVLNEHWMDSQRHKFVDGTSILNGHGGSGPEGSMWSYKHKEIVDLAVQLHRKCWDEALRLRDEYKNTDDEYYDESGNVKHQIQCLEELCHFLSSFVDQAESYVD